MAADIRKIYRGYFGKARQKNILRIRRDAFEEWLEKRTIYLLLLACYLYLCRVYYEEK